jgi:uncharacterized membrane protein
MDFQTVLQYELPFWHPAVVHVPPVLLVAAAAAATGYAVLGRPAWRLAALLLLVPGALAAWVAAETGETLYAAVEGEPQVEALIDAHHAAAAWALWTGAAAALAFLAATLWRRRRPAAGPEPLALRLLLLVPAWAAALCVAYAGHVGGLMVWGVPG